MMMGWINWIEDSLMCLVNKKRYSLQAGVALDDCPISLCPAHVTRWAHDTFHNVYIITCQDSDCPAPVSGARCCSAWGWCTDNCPQRWSSRNLSSVFKKKSSSVSSRNKSGGQPVQNKSLTRLVVDRDKPRKFYDFWMTQGYQLDHLLSLRLFENLLLGHGGP